MEFEIIDNKDVVTCRICGRKSKRIYGGHLKFHNLTSQEYLAMFPGSPLMADVDKEKMGQHMKLEKYKKMFSEMVSGEKNPAHRSKTTEEERKSRSPFSKSFSKYRDLEDKDSAVSDFTKKALSNRISPLQKEYYTTKGYSVEEAIQLISKRQSTFSLEKCIEKYGEVDGLKRWKERQYKWLESNKKINYSKISQELFISIYEKLKEINFRYRVFFARLDENGQIHNTNKNFEYRLKLNDSYILPDFFIPDLKLIIEFDGTYYHRDTPENKLREKNRDTNIINSGYNVIHVTESDYILNKKDTVINLVFEILKYNK